MYEIGDVFQIKESFPQKGWAGCYVEATNIRIWGIQGFVPTPMSHELIDIDWIYLEFVGKSPFPHKIEEN